MLRVLLAAAEGGHSLAQAQSLIWRGAAAAASANAAPAAAPWWRQAVPGAQAGGCSCSCSCSSGASAVPAGSAAHGRGLSTAAGEGGDAGGPGASSSGGSSSGSSGSGGYVGDGGGWSSGGGAEGTSPEPPAGSAPPPPPPQPRRERAPAFASGARLVQPLQRGGPQVVAQEGVVHINCSLNNTFVVLTDLNGQVKTYTSGGSVGFKNSGKSTPLAAERAAAELARRALEKGFYSVSVRMRGMGRNKQVALQALAAAGVAVTELREVTPTPYNGCRLPRKRRV